MGSDHSGSIVAALERHFGPYLSMILVTEELHDKKYDTRFLSRFFEEYISDFIKPDYRDREKKRFISGTVRGEIPTGLSFRESPKKVLADYFDERFGIMGQKFLKMKLRKFGLKNLDMAHPSNIPTLVFMILKSAFSSYFKESYFRDRAKEVFRRIYGEDGDFFSTMLLNLQPEIRKYLSMIFNDSIAGIIIEKKLASEGIKNLFMESMGSQLKFFSRLIDYIFLESISEERIVDIKMQFILFINMDLENKKRFYSENLYDFRQLGESSYFYQVSLEKLGVMDMSKDLSGEKKKELKEDIDSKPLDVVIKSRESKIGKIKHEELRQVFLDHFGPENAMSIMDQVISRAGLSSLDGTTSSERRRFVEVALRDFFGKYMSPQRRKQTEGKLKTIMGFTR
ncbi:MAG: hypothetical protein ACQEP1_03820 [Nanobdellota archaeon]